MHTYHSYVCRVHSVQTQLGRKKKKGKKKSKVKASQ
jgi:hypothetical protein